MVKQTAFKAGRDFFICVNGAWTHSYMRDDRVQSDSIHASVVVIAANSILRNHDASEKFVLTLEANSRELAK